MAEVWQQVREGGNVTAAAVREAVGARRFIRYAREPGEFAEWRRYAQPTERGRGGPDDEVHHLVVTGSGLPEHQGSDPLGCLLLPVRVQEALGELAAAAREGLLALSVGVGLGVLAELMEEEVVGVVGAKGKHDRERVAVRHGHEAGAVTLGGRRVVVERPRIRSADGSSELPVATYRHFVDRDPLTRVVFERMLAGVSTRRYRRIQEPVGREVEQRARSISKSSVSRAFVERTRKALSELMARRLDDVRLAVLMLDGVEFKGRTNIVRLGSRPRA